MKEKIKPSEKYADFLYRIIPFKESFKKCKFIYDLISGVHLFVPMILFYGIPYIIISEYYYYADMLTRDNIGKFNGVLLISGMIGGCLLSFLGETEEKLYNKIKNI